MQEQIEPISQGNVSHSAEAAIRRLITEGVLKAGERLNEVHLSERLQVSRTPIREALNRLVSEGAVEAKPRIGYSVKPLTVEEFSQLYDIRPLLDPAALRLAGIPNRQSLTQLEKLNRVLAKERDAEIAVSLDDEWHLALLASCPNRVLIGFIQNVMQRTRRYELALMRETQATTAASRSHDAILSALANGNLEQACTSLEANMREGRAQIIAWLESRQS